MKRILFLIAAAVAVFSCAKDNDPVNPDLTPVKLKMSVLPAGTKALVSGNADMGLEDVQIFVFDRDGNLETSTGVVSPDSEIELEVIPGTKTLWAAGNLPYTMNPANLAEMEAETFPLDDNALDKFIMSDRKSVLVTSADEVEFSLKRLACKIVIDKIVRDFTEPAYAEIPLYIKKIYLSNLAYSSTLLAESVVPDFFCVEKGVIGDITEEMEELVVDSGINYTLNEGGIYNVKHTFYALPNGVTNDTNGGVNFSPRRTRLVVECEYNGQTCYYPVTLPGIVNGSRGTLERNKVYHITALTLKRPGSGNPDVASEEVSSVQDCNFNITVDSWDAGHDYNESFM